VFCRKGKHLMCLKMGSQWQRLPILILFSNTTVMFHIKRKDLSLQTYKKLGLKDITRCSLKIAIFLHITPLVPVQDRHSVSWKGQCERAWNLGRSHHEKSYNIRFRSVSMTCLGRICPPTSGCWDTAETKSPLEWHSSCVFYQSTRTHIPNDNYHCTLSL
jgi:hypothetical protein